MLARTAAALLMANLRRGGRPALPRARTVAQRDGGHVTPRLSRMARSRRSARLARLAYTLISYQGSWHLFRTRTVPVSKTRYCPVLRRPDIEAAG